MHGYRFCQALNVERRALGHSHICIINRGDTESAEIEGEGGKVKGLWHVFNRLVTRLFADLFAYSLTHSLTIRSFAIEDRMNNNPIRILLADDHRMFRQGLRELLERKGGFVIVGEASTGREVLAQAAALQPDIVLLDIQMPEIDGVAVARQLAQAHPDVKVIMLTMYRQDQHLFEAIKAGARAYLLKDADADELIDVIERVYRGEAALDPTVTLRVFDEFRRLSADQDAEQLTERERDILTLLAAGYDNRTIAQRLFLSEKTVGNRLSEIFQKLGVSNRTQAALVAVQRGLIAPPKPESTE